MLLKNAAVQSSSSSVGLRDTFGKDVAKEQAGGKTAG